jgi:hypothetical protein
MKRILLTGLALTFVACSSPPKNEGPAWIHQPTRVVDNGYIVYVGMAHGFNAERAQFKAEGLALEDLANECSIVPKGTRIEDRYLTKDGESHHPEDVAYVKLALEFQECEGAKRAIDPSDIRKVANVSFTEQLKKYQDLSETGEMPDPQQVAQVTPPDQTAPPPERQAGWDDTTHFYAMRQYVAYQKEVVVLAPPTAYAPNTPATTQFVSQVQPASQQIAGIQSRSPVIAKGAYSSLPQRPVMARPASLAPPVARAAPAVKPPAGYQRNYSSQNRSGQPAKRGRGRRRREN